jgi:hypothetical protein
MLKYYFVKLTLILQSNIVHEPISDRVTKKFFVRTGALLREKGDTKNNCNYTIF